jgi:hypothetical protein
MIKEMGSSFNFSSAATDYKGFITSWELYRNFYRNQTDALSQLNLITDITNYRNIGYQIHNKFGDELIVMLIMPVMVWDLMYHLLLKNYRLQILLFLDNVTTIKMDLYF